MRSPVGEDGRRSQRARLRQDVADGQLGAGLDAAGRGQRGEDDGQSRVVPIWCVADHLENSIVVNRCELGHLD